MSKRIVTIGTMFFMLVLFSIQVLTVNAQLRDMGRGWCQLHGNYIGSSCPGCSSGGGTSGNNTRNTNNTKTKTSKADRAKQQLLDEAQAANNQGIKYWGDWDKAIPFFEEAVSKNPDDDIMRDNLAKAQALLANSKGIEFFNKKDYFNAVALFQEAANKKPDDKNIQENLIKAKEQLQLQQQELETQKKGKDAVLKMQQSVQAFTQTLNKVPSTGVLDFDGQNYNTTSKGNGLDFIAANNEVPTDKIVKQEQDEFDKMNAAWMVNQKKLIEQRLQEPNKWCNAIYNSLKINEPPLHFKKFSELQPGDVLLIASDGILGDIISGADRLTSGNQSTASHTVLYLKEVNGKKLFLDNTPGMSDATNGRGPHIINEEQFMKIYGQRDADVAKPAVLGVAQPLNTEETAKLWAAAHKLSIQELKSETSKSWNFLDKTNYGLWGNKNMVCSEASRWALVSIGREIPETESPLKKLMGVNFGPADFYKDVQNFIVTPLGVPHSK